MSEKINLEAKFAVLDKPYQPGIVGYINDYKLQVVKVKGPFAQARRNRRLLLGYQGPSHHPSQRPRR